MAFQVLQRFLSEDIQERVPLRARRLVVHSTANPGVGDESHFTWLDRKRQHGWTHYYLDWDSISQVVPEGFVAPAQGPTANRDTISFEICEGTTQEQFNQAWARAVWLAADILHRYGWGIEAMFSHADISRLYPAETDHTDPIGYFARWGRSWDQFTAEVEAARIGMGALPPFEPWQEAYIDRLMAEGLLSQRRHPNQQAVWWELAVQNLKLLDRVQVIETRLAQLASG